MMYVTQVLHDVTRITPVMRLGQASIFPSISVGRLLSAQTCRGQLHAAAQV